MLMEARQVKNALKAMPIKTDRLTGITVVDHLREMLKMLALGIFSTAWTGLPIWNRHLIRAAMESSIDRIVRGVRTAKTAVVSARFLRQ